MPDGNERRVDDKRIIEMHGDIKTLLANHENTKDYLKSVSKKVESHLEGHDDELSRVKSDINGIKWVGGFISVVFSSIGFFWRK